MRLRLTLLQDDGVERDIRVTVDVATTVGRLAARLAAGAYLPSRPMTLRVRSPRRAGAWILDPAARVGSGVLASGHRVEVFPVGQQEPGDLHLQPPAAYLEFLAGMLRGTRWPLPSGDNVIGRAPQCGVVLPDETVSRAHATIHVGITGMHVTDHASSNGTEVDGVRVHRAAIPSGARLSLGTVQCRVVRLATTAPDTPKTWIGPIVHLRSPRIEAEPVLVQESLPPPVERSVPRRLPLLALIAPVLLGVGLWAVTRSAMSLAFVGLSPVMMLSSHLDATVGERRRRARAVQEYRDRVGQIEDRVRRSQRAEVQARDAEVPQAAVVLEAVTTASPGLWARRPSEQLFGAVRLGVTSLPSRVRLVAPADTGADADVHRAARQVVKQLERVGPVPVLERLDVAQNLGVAGETSCAEEVLAAVTLQLVGLHSPRDVVLSAVADQAVAGRWAWLKWLPHTSGAASPIGGEPLVLGAAQERGLLARLEALIIARGRSQHPRTSNDGDGPVTWPPHDEGTYPSRPLVVILILARDLAARARWIRLAERGPAAGVHVIWLADTTTGLPNVCRSYVSAGDEPEVVFVDQGRHVALGSVERVALEDAARGARAMASVSDASEAENDSSDLPSSVRYEQVCARSSQGDVTRSVGAVIDAWRSATHDLAAVVGLGRDGPVRISLREHGPHALVGGTTGAGKSELLQTWIMSLAAAHSPSQLSFLLIDYKGGAAFTECRQLPHTVGLVTDLNDHLARRVLTSLRAELRHRERVLADAGVKDLMTLETRGDLGCPPALVVVVDEFAALAREIPEFVDGVVDIAQRGRSLGLHLVLATQRPAGVITDNIRANTNLRIALRMADAADSVDVVGVADAAELDPVVPGRALLRRGPGTPVLLQAAHLGARRRVAAAGTEILVEDLPFGPGAVWPAEQEIAGDAPRHHGGPHRGDEGERRGTAAERDLDALLHQIREAARACGVPAPRRPWLDPLDAVMDLGTLVEEHGQTGGLPVGRFDDPQRQRQGILTIDLDADGSLEVMGTAGSGRSGVLRAVGLAASARHSEDAVVIYAIDAAGGGLDVLDVLPTVGAVVRIEDSERCERLSRRLETLVTERERDFASRHASTITDYRARAGGPELPRVLVLVDGLTAIREIEGTRPEVDALLDALAHVARVGRRLGMHVVGTTERPGLLPASMAGSMTRRVVLRLAEESDGAAVGVPRGGFVDSSPGRGFVDGLEVQIGVWGGSSRLADQAVATHALAERLRLAGVEAAPPITTLPTLVRLADLPVADRGRVVVGLGDRDLSPVTVPTGGLIVVVGPWGSGRTSAVRTLVRGLVPRAPEARAFLLSGCRRSAVEPVATWVHVAQGVEEVDRAARGLLNPQGDGRTNGKETMLGSADVLVVEGAEELEGTPAEAGVALLLKEARRRGVTTIVETETVTGPAAWQVHSELRSAQAGLVLQPDEGDGMALFRTTFPRANRRDFPVGRGYLVERGVLTKVQVAMADETMLG